MTAISTETPKRSVLPRTYANTHAQRSRALADPEIPLPSDMAASDLESGRAAAKLPGAAGSLVRHRRVHQRCTQQPLRSGGKRLNSFLSGRLLVSNWSEKKNPRCILSARIHSTGSLASPKSQFHQCGSLMRDVSCVRVFTLKGVLLPLPSHTHCPHPHQCVNSWSM